MTKIPNLKQFKDIIILLIIGFVLFPAIAFAAKLYLEPAEGEYQPDDTFIVEIKIDVGQECINTIKGDLKFSQDILEVVDFSQGESILTLWLKKPQINQLEGLISFIGGIPAGYCGKIPGDPGESNLLGKMIFKVGEKGGNQAELKFLNTSQVLLNDGLGTPAKLSTKGAVFTILSEKLRISKNEWKKELIEDDIPPEPLEIEIHQDPAVFEGRYFVIFQTLDKQTGIDYYEVKERERDWKRAESPYLLEDQTLQSIIKVKAVDKAGNERIAEYVPPKPFPYWIIILTIIGIGIGYWLYRKSKWNIKNQK